jgi:hypothetical protein
MRQVQKKKMSEGHCRVMLRKAAADGSIKQYPSIAYLFISKASEQPVWAVINRDKVLMLSLSQGKRGLSEGENERNES